MADPILDFTLTPHARFEIERRRLDEAVVRRVLANPDQRIAVRIGARQKWSPLTGPPR